MFPMNKDTLSLLKRLELNQYESKTYLALVNSGAITATKLSDMAEIPRPRVYDVLSNLVKKGFVIAKPTRPTKYRALPLNAAIESLKKRKVKEHEKNIKELETLEEKLAEQFKEKIPDELGEEEVYVLRGRKNIYSVLGDLIQKANKHVVIASTSEGLERKKREYNMHLRKARDRGVEVMMNEGNHRYAVVDDNAMIFLSGSRTPKNEEAAWIKSGFVADSMKKMLTA